MTYGALSLLRGLWCLVSLGAFACAAVAAEEPPPTPDVTAHTVVIHNMGSTVDGKVGAKARTIQCQVNIDATYAHDYVNNTGGQVAWIEGGDSMSVPVNRADVPLSTSLSGAVFVGASRSPQSFHGDWSAAVLSVTHMTNETVHATWVDNPDGELQLALSDAQGHALPGYPSYEGGGIGLVTNWQQFTNASSFFPGKTELINWGIMQGVGMATNYTYGGQFGPVAAVFINQFETNLNAIPMGWTNDIRWQQVAAPVLDEDNWLSVELPGMTLWGMATDGWLWHWGPVVPEAIQGEFEFVCWLCRQMVTIVMAWALWWYIKQDVERQLMAMSQVNTPNTQNLEVLGCKLGPVGQAIAAAAVCAALFIAVYYMGRHVVGTWSVTLMHDVEIAITAGTGGGFSSTFVPKLAKFVFYVFPVDYVLSCVATWATYQLSRALVVRVALVGLKFAQGIV